MTEPNAQEIADALRAHFGTERTERPEPQAIEQIMRPFWVFSGETREALLALLRTQKRSGLNLYVSSWIEANEVVSAPDPKEKERRIRFLMMDTCTCVLEHLEAAIANTTEPVDPRVLSLLQHEYFQKKQN